MKEAITPSQAREISWNMMSRKVSMSKEEFKNYCLSYKDVKAIFLLAASLVFVQEECDPNVYQALIKMAEIVAVEPNNTVVTSSFPKEITLTLKDGPLGTTFGIRYLDQKQKQKHWYDYCCPCFGCGSG